ARPGVPAVPRRPRPARKAVRRKQPDHPADRLAAVGPGVRAEPAVDRRRTGEAGRLEEAVEVSDPSNWSGFRYAGIMKLGFEESQLAYTSGTQKARAWTEAW